MNKNTYDTLNWIARTLIPALTALYGAVAMIWNLPYAEAIMMTLGALETFLGSLLGGNSKKYFADKDIVPKANYLSDMPEEM